jgi:polyferredoxin
MKIKEIINELNKNKSKGLQLQKQNAILSSTWIIYKIENKFYYFDINQKIEFKKEYCYTEVELLDEFNNFNYKIELAIN